MHIFIFYAASLSQSYRLYSSKDHYEPRSHTHKLNAALNVCLNCPFGHRAMKDIGKNPINFIAHKLCNIRLYNSMVYKHIKQGGLTHTTTHSGNINTKITFFYCRKLMTERQIRNAKPATTFIHCHQCYYAARPECQPSSLHAKQISRAGTILWTF